MSTAFFIFLPQSARASWQAQAPSERRRHEQFLLSGTHQRDMAKRTLGSGSDLFLVDNSDKAWKAQRYLHQWADVAHAFDIATGYFQIGALLALDGQW